MENREFTTNQMAEIIGVNTKMIMHYKRMLGIPGRRVKTGKLMECYFTYTEYKQIETIIKAKSKLFTKKPKVVESVNPAIEQLKQEHPLVTDERCFKQSWWPDTIPNCFQDEDF